MTGLGPEPPAAPPPLRFRVAPWRPVPYDAGRMIAHEHTRTAAALAAVLLSTAATPPPSPPCTVVVSDAQALQQAVARAPAGRRAVVCLAAGEFRLRHFLALDRDDLTLRGTGAATVLRLEEGSESPVVVIGDAAHAAPERATAHVTVEHLRILGGGRGGSEVEPTHPYLTNSALVVRGGRHVRIRHVTVAACRSACILTERDSRDVTIAHNRIRDAVWDGISLNRTAKARVLHNRIRDCTAAGITTEHLESSLIADNVLRKNRTHGIYLSDSARNRIVGNRFVRNVLSGVFLTCAVERRDPPVRCWRDSMSRANFFAQNVFVQNRVAFMVAANRAAACRGRGFVPNRSRGDRFWRNPPEAAAGTRGAGCLELVSPRPESDSTALRQRREARYGMGPKGTIPFGMTASTKSPVALPPATAARKRMRTPSPGAMARTFTCFRRLVGAAPSLER
jgi:parallel beta-helix repeat protein